MFRDRNNMKLNGDGSVTQYIGLKAPKRYENNWIPTGGKISFLLLRFCSSEGAILNGAFVLNEVELVK